LATPLTKPDALPAELQGLLVAIDACEREAESLVSDLTEEELNWQERPGKTWSVGQCLDHLAIMNTFYVSGFVPLVERARTASAGPFRGLASSAGGQWFINSFEPPVKRRLKSPQQTVPRSTVSRAGIVEAYQKSHDLYRQLVRASAAVDVTRVKGPNPFFHFIPMRVSTVLKIIPAHDRRHLWQAQNVKRACRLKA
jgi:hypothetical protein